MNIKVEIPALEGIVPAIVQLAQAIAGGISAPAKKTATKKTAAKKTAKKEVEEPAEPEAEETPAVTKEELVTLGKKLCEITGGTQKTLRAALDTVIKGEKISTCDPEKYPAVKEAIEKAIEENTFR